MDEVGWELQVAVEVNDAYGAVGAVDRAKKRKSDGMVTTKGDDARERLATLGIEARLLSVGLWCTVEDAVVALFDLFDCPGIVISVEMALSIYPFFLALKVYIRSYWDITTIQNSSRA